MGLVFSRRAPCTPLREDVCAQYVAALHVHAALIAWTDESSLCSACLACVCEPLQQPCAAVNTCCHGSSHGLTHPHTHPNQFTLTHPLSHGNAEPHTYPCRHARSHSLTKPHGYTLSYASRHSS